jgi:uncharacterized protein
MSMRMEKGQWNPYLAGSLGGLVIVGSVWLSGKYAGASTTFVRGAGLIENFLVPGRVEQVDYFTKTGLVIDWQWMFVAGILLGSLLSALTSGSYKLQAVPDMWRSRFGATPGKRGLTAFSGGVIAMYGARLADG